MQLFAEIQRGQHTPSLCLIFPLMKCLQGEEVQVLKLKRDLKKSTEDCGGIVFTFKLFLHNKQHEESYITINTEKVNNTG